MWQMDFIIYSITSLYVIFSCHYQEIPKVLFFLPIQMMVGIVSSTHIFSWVPMTQDDTLEDHTTITHHFISESFNAYLLIFTNIIRAYLLPGSVLGTDVIQQKARKKRLSMPTLFLHPMISQKPDYNFSAVRNTD